jgi:preprotein translocase subunit SecG
MQALLLIIHVLVAVALVALVLLQHGKGADMGAAFGGASSTMFGSQGATPFLVKVTGIIAFIFFCTSLALNYWVSEHARPVNILEVPDTTLGIPADQVHKNDNKVPGKN